MSERATNVAKHAQFQADFERGWQDGLLQLKATWKRLRASRVNGIRVMRMLLAAEAGPREPSFDPFHRLVDVESDDFFEHAMELVQNCTSPVLCLAGTQENSHTENCGHNAGQKIWAE